MHVLVTGAGGHLGRKLFDFLVVKAGVTVTGLDLRTVDHPDIHLAGDREPSASWQSSVRNNMDATMALYHHAVEQGVSRVVLASSNWVQGDKRFSNEVLGQDTPPGPVNAYGMSKLFCERAGQYFSEVHGLSVICARIGWTQWTHGNRPGAHMAMGRWGQEMWLSDRDFLDGMFAAVTARDVGFATVNLMSNNPGMRWDIAEAAEIIGYHPQDGAQAALTPGIRLKSWIKKLISHSLPRWFDRRFPEW